jgi:metal-dependent hydrolase (beta-lactamase superfamily II)
MPAVLHEAGPGQRIDLEPMDRVEITTLMDNVTDVFMPDQGPARRPGPTVGHTRPSAIMAGGTAPDALVAEHGFSMLVTVHKGTGTHRVLFDAGTSPDGVVENMRRLDIDPGSVEAIVCSHGHFDHITGIDGLIRAVGRANMPVLIHPYFWRRRRVRLVLDDQAIVINVAGKGLIVLTGCGHAGIVNICRYARRLTGDQPLYAAMGGFHLNGPLFEPLIPRVLDELHAMSPQVLVPAHCTGWRAQHAMSRSFDEAFVPNTVGSRFLL